MSTEGACGSASARSAHSSESLRPSGEHLVLGPARVELGQQLGRSALDVLEQVDAAVEQLPSGVRVAAETHLEVEPAHAVGGLELVAVRQRLVHGFLV